MSCIQEDILLTDIVMPGSHDAGSYASKIWDKTQDLSFSEQLKIGTRYFDIRVTNTENENLGNYENLHLYHGYIPSDTTFYEATLEIKKFIDDNPSEFLILDFQHFRLNPYEDTIALIEKVLEPEKYALDSSYDISTLTMQTIRKIDARYMIIWGNFSSYTQLNRNYLYNRLDTLNSPYIEEYHNSTDAQVLLNTGFTRYYDSKDERLFVLQCQKTGTVSNILTLLPLNNELEFAPAAKEFIQNLGTDIRLEKTNIIMRDFLNKEKTTDILALNLKKNNINMKKIKAFESLLSI